MNKHIQFRLTQAQQIENLSPCPRGRVGAVIFNPDSYTVISDGYNGPPRKGGQLCGGNECTRSNLNVESGTRCEIGCHHAEANAISNAARNGISTLGMSMAVTCEPCLMCAKLIHHSGISAVYYTGNNYSTDGVAYLRRNGIGLHNIDRVVKNSTN
tara:strand:+ start:1723 stop:2190 length:468 start_codon:yes stop_codon:yes gene_type:complete